MPTDVSPNRHVLSMAHGENGAVYFAVLEILA